MTLRGGHRRRGAVTPAVILTAALVLSACANDAEPSQPPTSTPTATALPATPSSTPSTDDGGQTEPYVGVDLCQALDRRALSRITGLALRPGTFDGVRCTWEAEGGNGALIVGQQPAFHTSGHIDRLQELDVGQAVEVAGAQDAVAVTVNSGPESDTKISLLAKVGDLQVFVVLRGNDPTIDEVVQVAELAIAG